METDAVIHMQNLIRSGKLQLCWSFVLDYENASNPFKEVRNQIQRWKQVAIVDCTLTDKVLKKSEELMDVGLRQMDAAHIACAIHLEADCFITTDKRILNKLITGISIFNPIDFIRRYADVK